MYTKFSKKQLLELREWLWYDMKASEYKSKAIHCKTKEQFIEVQKILFRKGWNRIINSDVLDERDCYEEKSCILYNDKFRYRDTNQYKKRWYTIISYKEFLKMEGVEESIVDSTDEPYQFKVGDTVRYEYDWKIYQDTICLVLRKVVGMTNDPHSVSLERLELVTPFEWPIEWFSDNKAWTEEEVRNWHIEKVEHKINRVEIIDETGRAYEWIKR